MSTKGASQNKNYLEEQLVIAKNSLVKAEQAYSNFQSANKALDIGEQAKGTIKGIADLIAQKIALEVQLTTLRRQYTDSSQEVKNTKKSIEGLVATIKNLESKGIISAYPTVGAVPSIAQENVRLIREVKIQESLVELLIKQYELSSISEQKNIANIQIVQNAREPDRKAKPPRALIMIGLTIVSFMSVVFMIMVYDKYYYLLKEHNIEINTIWATIKSKMKKDV